MQRTARQINFLFNVPHFWLSFHHRQLDTVLCYKRVYLGTYFKQTGTKRPQRLGTFRLKRTLYTPQWTWLKYYYVGPQPPPSRLLWFLFKIMSCLFRWISRLFRRDDNQLVTFNNWKITGVWYLCVLIKYFSFMCVS